MKNIKFYKNFLVFCILFFTLIISISSIYASDIDSIDNQDDNNVSTESVENEIAVENCTTNIDSDTKVETSNSSAGINDSSQNSNTLITYDEAYQKSAVEFSPIKSEYSSGYVTCTVKAYSVLNFNGTKYNDPAYGSIIKLRIYTGNSLKSYIGKINNDGVALIKVQNLSLGYHEVEIFVDGKKRLTSDITVVKSSTRTYAPDKTIKYKKNTYYKIKVLDSHNNFVKNTVLKIKVYTGKKYKTYKLTTNSKGVAKLKTGKFALGTHKIVIKSGSKNYKIDKTSRIILKKKVPKKVELLKASAPAKTVKYKEDSYLGITVKNNYNDPVKGIALKVKVYTGKNVKTYALKTNSKGVAKLKTRSLSLGTHKVIISSNSKNYKINKASKIIVNKALANNRVETAVLKSIQFYPDNDTYKVKLIWNSKKGSDYQVLRKTNESYGLLSTVKAASGNMKFYDNVENGILYTYAVREVVVKNNEKILGPYDMEGLKMMDCPNVTVDFQNLKADIQWDAIDGATKYIIFRKMGRDSQFKYIASVGSDELSYTDFYYKSSDMLSEIMNSKTFIDSSFNNLFYTVRACKVTNIDGVDMISYGLYLKDGDFNLETPSIVSLIDNTITWGSVPNAEGYYVLKRENTSDEWQTIGEIPQEDCTVISMKLDEIDNSSYYSVKAFAHKNGRIVCSDYDVGFTLRNFSQENSQYRVLYFGDSITYGSPYKSPLSRHIFSIPHRVAQLLGCVYYNPSIPGSTYHDLGQNQGVNIENSNYYRYRICREVVDPISIGELPGNWENLDTSKNSEGITNTSIDDYNIVVLAAGTNDYLDNSELGELNSSDTFTFNGAFNHIMEKIEDASKVRVDRGDSPIKVVFVDLYYSDRTYTPKIRQNRDITPNHIGLTLTDYQNELHKQFNKWESSEYLTLYNFKTREYNIVNEENCPYAASDNLHFTKFTYGQYGNAFADFLKKYVFE